MLLLPLAVLLLVYVSWRARREFDSYFNPWFFFLSTEVFLVHLLSIFCAIDLELIDSPHRLRELLLCSSLYIVGYSIAYFVRPRTLRQVMNAGMRLMPDVRCTAKTGMCCYAFLGLAFMLLAGLGAAGTLWFTDPRDAYLNYRGATGDGALFVLAQWALMLSAVVNLSVVRDRRSALVFTLVVHCLLAYFLGSKQILLNLVVFALFVIDNKFKIIRFRHFIILGAVAAFIFVVLLGGTEDSTPLVFAKLYFSEYAANTANIFDAAVTSSFLPGEIFISNIWTFIPRFLVENKPYEYGVVLINSVLFPGAAERGQTPGLLNWSAWFVDFGFIGVLLFGIIRGTLEGAIFRTAKFFGDSAIKVAFLFSAAVTPIFLYAPITYQFVFLLLSSFALHWITRRKIKRTKRIGTASHKPQLQATN